MSTRTPFDENRLRALFEEIEAPPSLDDRWRAGSAKPHRPSASTRVRAAAVVVGVLTVGAVVFGVASTNQQPDPGPEITITEVPSTSSEPPPPTSAREIPGTVVSVPPSGPGAPPAVTVGPPVTPSPGAPVVAPARGALPPGEWPAAGNAGVPAGTKLGSRTGEFHVTEPGAVISDLRVAGSIIVDAPDVTLRRVLVVPAGAGPGVRQRPTAPGLRIEDSDISGSGGPVAVLQEAAGLTVSRSDVHGATTAIAVASDATIVDSYLHSSTPGPGIHSVSTNAGARLVVRHNTLLEIALFDDAGPVVDVTIENNRLATIGAPPGAASHDIRVRGNRFLAPAKDYRPSPSTGWNAQAPGNTWSGNVDDDSGQPVNP